MATLAEQWEERGIRKGIQQGRQEGKREGKQEAFQELISDGLDAKFGEAGLSLMPHIQKIQDLERLRALLKRMWTTTDLEEFRKQIQLG
ncbi:MAG: hypothetical protein ACLFRG_07100 [Desulfococcaceae bacterium]